MVKLEKLFIIVTITLSIIIIDYCSLGHGIYLRRFAKKKFLEGFILGLMIGREFTKGKKDMGLNHLPVPIPFPMPPPIHVHGNTPHNHVHSHNQGFGHGYGHGHRVGYLPQDSHSASASLMNQVRSTGSPFTPVKSGLQMPVYLKHKRKDPTKGQRIKIKDKDQDQESTD